jgi:hypothetical protein
LEKYRFGQHESSQVKSELDFYQVEKGERDPWQYAIYHFGTGPNPYSSVHWGYYPNGWKEAPQE